MSMKSSLAWPGALAALLVALAPFSAIAQTKGGNSGNGSPGVPQGPKDVPEFEGSALGIALAVGVGAVLVFRGRKQRKGD